MERLIGFDPQLLADAAIVAVNVFILFFALSYLLFEPARDFMKKRQEKIANELASAADSERVAKELKIQYEDKLSQIDKEAEFILEEARKKAKKREAEIIEEAKQEASRILERANKEIALEKEKAAFELKQEIVNLSVMMTKKIVSSTINEDIHKELIEKTLQGMGESTWQN